MLASYQVSLTRIGPSYQANLNSTLKKTLRTKLGSAMWLSSNKNLPDQQIVDYVNNAKNFQNLNADQALYILMNNNCNIETSVESCNLIVSKDAPNFSDVQKKIMAEYIRYTIFDVEKVKKF
ncbi:MAG: hypothetical protein MHPSP_004115, partial [Paramarteilia canceri]